METSHALEETVRRIVLMEIYFDALCAAVERVPYTLREDGPLREMLRGLLNYYENGQWRVDYEMDERGELPGDLKRGVLSEDGVYDLLSEIQRVAEI